MGYYDILKKHKEEFRIFQLTMLLVTLDKYPEIDNALRDNKPKKDIVDLVIGGKFLKENKINEIEDGE